MKHSVHINASLRINTKSKINKPQQMTVITAGALIGSFTVTVYKIYCRTCNIQTTQILRIYASTFKAAFLSDRRKQS